MRAALSAAAALVALQLLGPSSELLTGTVALAGAACGLVLIICVLRTPAGCVVASFFTTLGRLALTNYVTATLLLIMTGVGFTVNHLETDLLWPMTMIACVVILLLQVITSHLWSITIGQGPLEAAWRWVTWAGAAPATTHRVVTGSPLPGRRVASQ
ncbi:DUF418 domain-containing protein [Propionibacteriaceae bacterium Y1700]|uniref:DUF418 domain-containing protein n=1 Tax=Microlunatus sp. Y1700 TaxID=3418487 RepID=UPI003DA6DAE5